MDKRKKWLIAGFVAVGSVTAILWMKNRTDGNEPIRVLERNPPGMGDSELQMEVQTGEGSFPIDFRLKERYYRQEELEQVFEQGEEFLDSIWLAQNPSAQNVSENLYFPTRIEALGLTVRWETESYRWIQTNGVITEEARAQAPLETFIQAVMVYGTEERTINYPLTVVCPEKDEKTMIQESVLELLESQQTELATEETMALPERIGDVTLTWYGRETPIWPKLFVFGNLCVVLVYFSQEEKRMKQIKNREDGLRQDYPEIVYRLVLLVSSGMTVRSAWEKMISDYQGWRDATGKSRWGYEEMEMALREMNYGVPELKAYESFGKRCGTQGYIRLASLLIQQVKRGAKGMNQLLLQEVAEAEVLRRENARKSAEESATRLILPMILLMTVVFAVLMIPAFLSMSF